MARVPLQKPGQRVVTRYRDADGNLVLETEFNERIVLDQDNNAVLYREADNVQLNSGELFNPSMSSGQKPVLLPGICDLCREAGHRVLTNSKHLRLCANCGKPVCAKHRSQSRYDKKFRCPRCHRRHRWGLFFRAIFMKAEDE